MTKERDYSFEALAAATSTDMVAGRGELNISLKTIRAAHPELTDYALADEIHERAKLYRSVMGDEILLTPTALAKHWRRVLEESTRPKETAGTNRHSGNRECELCGGDRFVVVCTRRPTDTEWMRAHSIKANADALIEEMAPCPQCNAVEISHWRHDGTRFVTPDPGRVREMMQG